MANIALQAECKKNPTARLILDYHYYMENIKILLIEPNDTVGELITKSLQRSFNAEVILYKTSNQATDALKKGEIFSLIIARNRAEATAETPADLIAGNLVNLIYDLSLKIPLVVIGEFEHSYKKYLLVSEPLRLEEINRLVLNALGLKRENFDHLKLPDYVPFPVKYFYLMSNSPCDVYIRLMKKAGDEYVKRLNKGENFDKEALVKYEELGVSDFYITKDDYDVFMNGLFTQTMSNLKKSRTSDESIEVIGDSFVISADLLRSLGFTPICLAMVDQTINMMKSQIQKADKLGPLLKKLLSDKMSYSYRRSYLISAIAYRLLPRMEWGSADQQNSLLEKICFVSYLHDIYLEDEKLLKITDLTQMRQSGLSPREMDTLNNHAHHAATLVQSYPKLPQGVDLIIKQHHGVSNGVGFPEVLTTAISPMAIFFMVLEDFATNILNIPDSNENLAQSLKDAIKPLKEKYQLPSYRKIVTEIENLVTPKK